MLNQIAKKRCQNKGNGILYKMAISDFQNFWILTPKISKNKFFWKKCSKIQNFQNFQKTVLYVWDTHESSSHAKFQIRISIFDPQMTVISVKCGDVIKINHIFGPFIDIVRKNKLHRWIPEMQLNQKSAFYFQNFEFWKLTFFDLFWPFLPDREVKSENYRCHWILRLKLFI